VNAVAVYGVSSVHTGVLAE